MFGFWSGNASLGNIFGSLIVASVLNYGYEYGMLLNSVLLLCGSLVVLLCMVPHPNMIGLPRFVVVVVVRTRLESLCNQHRQSVCLSDEVLILPTIRFF